MLHEHRCCNRHSITIERTSTDIFGFEIIDGHRLLCFDVFSHLCLEFPPIISLPTLAYLQWCNLQTEITIVVTDEQLL